MAKMHRNLTTRVATGILVVALAALMSPAAFRTADTSAAALDCPAGYHPWDQERAAEHRMKLRTLPFGVRGGARGPGSPDT
jgi:hypothetical protein